ncbi:MAG: hypothetical protein HY459_02075 [Parcubacteria group bacterium]|nr:hypothetical protein [Parcubacteria group bacterium]
MAVALTAACTQTVGERFNHTYVDRIVIGKTTIREALTNLGQPFQKTITPPKGETWVYVFKTATVTPTIASIFNVYAANTSRSSKQLTITFTEGVVSGCSLVTSDSPTAGYLSSSGGTNVMTTCGNRTTQ